MIVGLEEALFLMGRVDPTPDDRAAVALYLPVAQCNVQDHLGFVVEQTTYTEFYPRALVDQSGRQPGSELLDVVGDTAVFMSDSSNRLLQLDNLPVRSITSIWENPVGHFGDGAFDATHLLAAGTNYSLVREAAGISRSGLVQRLDGAWSAAPGSIKIIYVAGFSADELASDLYATFKGALIITLADLFDRFKLSEGDMPARQVTSMTLGGGTQMTFVQNRMRGEPVPDEAADMLDPWVSYDDLEI